MKEAHIILRHFTVFKTKSVHMVIFTRSPHVPSIPVCVVPGLIWASASTPPLLRPWRVRVPSWISASIPGLILSLISASCPALIRTPLPACHPGLIRPTLSSVPAWNPYLVLTGVSPSVSARVPHLVLGSVSAWSPGVRSSLPAGVPALIMRLGLLPASFWALRPNILRDQSWREPCSGRTDGPWVWPIGQAIWWHHRTAGCRVIYCSQGNTLEVLIPNKRKKKLKLKVSKCWWRQEPHLVLNRLFNCSVGQRV